MTNNSEPTCPQCEGQLWRCARLDGGVLMHYCNSDGCEYTWSRGGAITEAEAARLVSILSGEISFRQALLSNPKAESLGANVTELEGSIKIDRAIMAKLMAIDDER